MDEILDIFGQQPFFTLNTQIAYAFPLNTTDASPQTTHKTIIETLSNGLKRLYAAFPWLACQVINEGSSPESSGTYRFAPLNPAPSIIVKDYTHEHSIPSYNDLRRERFPMRLLPEETFASRATFTGPATKENPAPVLTIQASFLRGGMVLCFAAQHNTMDMNGQGFVMRMFHKACQGEAFTEDEVECGNLPREGIVPLLGEEWIPGVEMEGRIVKDPQKARRRDGDGDGDEEAEVGSEEVDRPKFISTYFSISAAALAALKKRAEEVVQPPEYISTDDALTAFLWQSILRARQSRIPPGRTSTISRALNLRKALDIPSAYPGPIQDSIHTTFPVTSLAYSPLGTIAFALRSALDPQAIAFQARAIATYLTRTREKSLYSCTADFDMGIDLCVSSWTGVPAYLLNFGLGLGTPEAVRKPQFEAVEGLCFTMPIMAEGDVAVAMCLREDDLERLQTDADFARFAEYIG